ncbi:Heterokaryon incompatibility protein (HET) domain containing protein [Rhypophila decipiens]
MRLLNTASLQLTEFFSDIPSYAILSHTWGSEEITFQDLSETHLHPNSSLSATTRNRKGYRKIVDFCNKTRADDFDWAWADTCCIDKSSSSELSEAINSMYKWYSKSSVCYVYLEDFSPLPPGWHVSSSTWGPFVASRWFSRRWTLQELIAPESVTFFANDWSDLGSKFSTRNILAEHTRVPKNVLRGVSPSVCSAAERMSWAAERETSREEDLAYSLLGIFGIHMPLLYGEGGPRVFQRLQEEIWKREEAFSLLLWPLLDLEGDLVSPSISALAPHPRHFKVPFDIPILPEAPKQRAGSNAFTPIGKLTLPTWDAVREDHKSFAWDFSQKLLTGSHPSNQPERLARARQARYAESFPIITPRGLSTFLAVTEFGDQEILAWPFCRIGEFRICIRLGIRDPEFGSRLRNDDIPVEVSRPSGHEGLWLLYDSVPDNDHTLGFNSCNPSGLDWILRKIFLQVQEQPERGRTRARSILDEFSFFAEIKADSTTGNPLSSSGKQVMTEVVGFFPQKACIINQGRDVMDCQEVTNWQPPYPGVKAGVLLRIWDLGSVLSRSRSPAYEADDLPNSFLVVVAVSQHHSGTRYPTPCCLIQRVECPGGSTLHDESYHSRYTLNCKGSVCDCCDRPAITLRHMGVNFQRVAAIQYSRRKPIDGLSLVISVGIISDAEEAGAMS